MNLWPAAAIVTDDDGRERCPNDREMTAMEQAAVAEFIASKAEIYAIRPHISQARMERPIPATIMSMEDAAGHDVRGGAPLRLLRNVPAVLHLDGRAFSSSDTITYPTGITDSVPPSRTTTRTTLTVIAALSMVAGLYDFIFNGNAVRGVFLVR